MARSDEALQRAVRNAVAAAGALIGLAVVLKDLRDKAATLFGVDEGWIGASGVILTLSFVWFFWIGPRVTRWWRARNAEPKVKSDGFRLHPYDSSDRSIFAREDKEHDRILNWLRGATDPLLYLAGASGSGKSSLLHAYVLPELSANGGHVCTTVRGVHQPLAQIRRSLLRPDAVWQSPKDDAQESTTDLALRAAAHLAKSDRRLYIIFDQFEELLILHERSSAEVTGVLEFIKAVSSADGDQAATTSATGPVVVLVMRSDYEGRVRELDLPAELMGVNKEVVRLVSEPHAEEFLERGGLKDAAMRKGLVREASDLEETKGRLRFITLNFLGLAASQAPGRVRGGRTGKRLLRGAVRAWVMEPGVRGQAAAVLRPLISDEETKKPMALGEVVQASGLREREVARVLMQFERDGLVRHYQNEKDIWEISHDFVARLLQRVLDDLRGSLLVRSRPWMSAAAGTVILLALAGLGVGRYLRYDRALLAWQIAEGRVVDALGPQRGKRVEFDRAPAVTVATLKYLASLPERREVTELDLSGVYVTDAMVEELNRADMGLTALTSLIFLYSGVTDAGVKGLARADTHLRALTSLSLDGAWITDAGVKELARTDMGLKALTSLSLNGTKVTDAGVKELARANTGLKGITWLGLAGADVTDAGIKELARSDTGLKSLTSLSISSMQITDAGVEELACPSTGLKALTWLSISDSQVTDAGVKALACADTGLKALTWLSLSGTQVTDTGIKELIRAGTGLKALTALGLYRTHVTEVGVKALARADTGLKALVSLSLSDTQVTDEGVRELARPDTGLKALTSLSLRGTRVSDAGVKELARADTGLKSLTLLDFDGASVTDAAMKELARADMGIKALTSLTISGTQVTDTGVKELCRADTGLKALTSLGLGGSGVTDNGIKELARAGTGLNAVTSLSLDGTQVTDAGIKELARANTGLKNLTSLTIYSGVVTDAGMKELARAETGLKALTSLTIYSPQITDAGWAAVRARFPGIEIHR